jgi:hypothetical protein
MIGYLPAPFNPRLYKGVGVGGICMIRFLGLRPRFTPSQFGIDSENAAHRIAVEWDLNGEKFEGVYIPKRNTSSRFNYLAGGRVFPGIFQMSRFHVLERNDMYQVKITEQSENEPMVFFDGEVSPHLLGNSIFPNLETASEFFVKSAVGYSISKDQSHFQGMELRLMEWDIKPMKINQAFVRLFEEDRHFPKGTTVLDSAMLMRNLRHEWHRIPEIGKIISTETRP